MPRPQGKVPGPSCPARGKTVDSRWRPAASGGKQAGMFSVPRIQAVAVALAWAVRAAVAAGFPEPYDSEKAGAHPMPPAEALAGFKMPPGFQATVFAAEPMVRQPISMTFDGRGRLWVAENYTYAEAKVNYATNLSDRIVVLADADGDGVADSRKVFWDEGKILTSVEVGRGGVFALCPPTLLFLADHDGDDKPDGPPEVLLDGFATTTGNRHTFANGLKWGPDGWLWGRIGISSGARVGRPGDPDSARVELRGGIWRYHPGRRVFEAVCHGTTNPWGLDWNAEGEPFFINTVIGHFWHAIPGAHFQRMHGDDVMPHAYGFIGQHADHHHFDTGAGWTKSRADAGGVAAPTSDALGGGHAHAGLMIYQGGNWPAEYRGRAFTLNLHGHRINQERIERDGSGYVARHLPDLLSVPDPWFRGLDLVAGPDGGVFVSDWSDTGECHDHDGVHRNSGRIYKVTHGKPAPVRLPDLAKLPPAGLATLALGPDDWLARHARQELAGRDPDEGTRWALAATLRDEYRRRTNPADALRALWALNALGTLTPDWLVARTGDDDEHARSWAVRLLAEHFRVSDRGEGGATDLDAATRTKVVERFARLAERDRSALVRLYVASSLQRLPYAARLAIGRRLVARAEDVSDHNLPLLEWVGLEPVVAADPDAALELMASSVHPVLRRHIARRLAEAIDARPGPVDRLLRWATGRGATEQGDVAAGLSDAMRGRRRAAAPRAWDRFAALAGQSPSADTRDRVRGLGAVFGDGRALGELRALAMDPKADAVARRTALRALVEARADQLGALLRGLVDDGALRTAALVALLETNDPDAVALASSRITWLGIEERPALLAAMASRPAAASALLDAVAAGRLPRADVSAFHARQIAGLGDPRLARRLSEVWGSVRVDQGQQKVLVDRWRARLAPAKLAGASALRGLVVFRKTCAACHQLFGEGGTVGPDLTGSGRANLDYLLENIVTPSAVVPADYRATVATLVDGRTLTGLLRDANARTVTLVTQGERVTLERREIARLDTLDQSLMPDGLLDGLAESEARDLVVYLMQPRQVHAE